MSFSIGITDHLEGPAKRPSAEIYDEVAQTVEAADRLGVRYAWFAEHHVHAHNGHLPTPLLLALHLAGRTKTIHLGAAVICLNLHHALHIAEQLAVADTLSGARMCVGFGSGSTVEELALFGAEALDESQRHANFKAALLTIKEAWRGGILPRPAADLPGRCWAAVNSIGAAKVAGAVNFNVLFSHLRTPAQYCDYTAAYRAAGGTGLIAANRPVFVGPDDATAFKDAEAALKTLWRRFQRDGKIAADMPEPATVEALSAHPINFIVGGPQTVVRELRRLHEQAPFDVANLELRWEGLTHAQVMGSTQRLGDVMRLLRGAGP